MHGKIMRVLSGLLSLIFISFVFNWLFSSVFFINNDYIIRALEPNSTKSDSLIFGSNHTAALSLIPLMIKEMENTNATSIPIKQVINATPSNVTLLQNFSRHNVLNNISNNILLINTDHKNFNTSILKPTSNFIPKNKTDLIPYVVNLTKNTNATDIAIAKTINRTPKNATDVAIAKTINATPSNVTFLQNLSKNNVLNNMYNKMKNQK